MADGSGFELDSVVHEFYIRLGLLLLLPGVSPARLLCDKGLYC